MDFFYPNYTNDMWRIFGIIFKNDKLHFVDEAAHTYKLSDIVQLLNEEGIGMYDTARVVRRTKNTASDKDLEVVEPTDLDALLEAAPHCHNLVTTGQKATDVLCAHFQISQPAVGKFVEFQTKDGRRMRLFRMPSSSRAYPMKVEKKAKSYQKMFNSII